jgi:hypothetical protein
MEWLRALMLFQIFRTKIKKSKTYSDVVKGLSNGTTLMQIQSGRTVPLITFKYIAIQIVSEFKTSLPMESWK